MLLKIPFYFLLILQSFCISFGSSERFIFDNDKYTLMQYDFLYDDFNKIETDIYFFDNEKINDFLYDENVVISDVEFKKYELYKSNVNRYSLELIKIDIMMKEKENITKIESSNPNCYFFFNYDLVRFEKYSGSPMAKWEGQSPALHVILARKGKSSFGGKISTNLKIYLQYLMHRIL